MAESSGQCVLVVDDDPIILDALCSLLQTKGFEAPGACCADEAIALLDHGLEPDAILTDLTMPGRSGEDLVDHVRACPRTAGTVVVAMSACRRTLVELRPEVDGRLLKPFGFPALLEALARAWAMHPLPR